MGEIHDLGPHDRMSPEEALQTCIRDIETFQCVLILGWDNDGDLIHRSAGLTRGDANWLVDAAKQDILNKHTDMSGAGSLIKGKFNEEDSHKAEQARVITLSTRGGKGQDDPGQ